MSAPAAGEDVSPEADPRRIEWVPLDEITEDPDNPKAHDEDLIAASVDRHGVIDLMTRDDRTGYLISGHGRLRTYRTRRDTGAEPPPGVRLTPDGTWLVPVVTGWASADDLDARAALITLNRSTEAGGWIDDVLLASLDRLREAEDGLAGVGFDLTDIEDLRARLAAVDTPPPVDAPSLADRFVVPPFTVLDARGGDWQDRKRRWLALGIQSEVGRGVEVSPHPEAAESVTERVADVSEGTDLWDQARAALSTAVTAKGWRHRDLDEYLGTNGMAGHYLGRSQPEVPTPGQWTRLEEVLDLPADLHDPMTLTRTRPGAVTGTGRGPKGLGAVQTNLDGVDAARYGRSIKPNLAGALAGERTLGQGLQAHRDPVTGELVYTQTTAAGVSIFDPVLCELAYRWFSPPAGHVLDPFAGGSVRGIVATALGRHYTGVELRPEQVAANADQARVIIPRLTSSAIGHPLWLEGDSREILPTLADREDVPAADLVFSCPPYADLEVYSDDPADLSNMAYDDFLTAYRQIIAASCALLRDDRFAVWVIGEVRDKRGLYRGLVPDTIRAFTDAGLALYNEAVLVTPVGSLPIRAGRQFAAGRKLGKTHQTVLVFCKGDPRAAADACGLVEVQMPEGVDDTA